MLVLVLGRGARWSSTLVVVVVVVVVVAVAVVVVVVVVAAAAARVAPSCAFQELQLSSLDMEDGCSQLDAKWGALRTTARKSVSAIV